MLVFRYKVISSIVFQYQDKALLAEFAVRDSGALPGKK